MLFDYKFFKAPIEKYIGGVQLKIKKTLIACFSRCSLLVEVVLDDVDTSKLVSIRSICNSCPNLERVSMKNWNVQNLVNCDYAFANCPCLKLIEIEWENLNPRINCFMTLFNSNPAILSNTDFKFDLNSESPYLCF